MTIYLFLPLLAFCTNAILAPLVLWGHLKQRMHWVFALFLISMALWGGTIFLMRSSPTLEQAFFWDKLALINFSLIVVFFLHFTYLFSGIQASRKVLLASYVTIPTVTVLSFADLIAQGMQVKFYGYAPVPGVLLPLYLAMVYSCVLLALRNLVSVYRRPTSQVQRNRAGYLITATGFSLLGATTDWLPVLGLPLYPLGIVGNVLFAALASVTITRHRLLDIHVALRRTIGFLLVIVFIAGLYVLASLLIHRTFGSNILTVSVSIGVGLMVAGYLVFSPLLDRVQDGIDRVFLRQRWGPLQELLQFTTETRDITDLNALSVSLLQLVRRAMDTQVAVLLQPERDDGSPWVSPALGTDARLPASLNSDSPWLQRLAREDHAYLAEEMFSLPEWQYVPSMVRAQIESLEINVFLPLRYNQKLTGLLLLGPKTSRRGYSLEELDLLEAVALHAATTMANAHLYEELRFQLQELKETQAQLVQSGKLASVGTLAAGIAHEVNNPIFAISGMAELLLSSPERHLKSEQAAEYVTVISDMSQRIARVAQGMLAYSRNDEVPTTVSLNEVAEDTLRLMEHKLMSGGIEVVRRYAKELPTTVAVSNQLQQALMNLIMNASDAMNGSGTLTLRTGVSGEKVWISCTDTGNGIPQSVLNRIFDAFFTTKPVGKGTGLGLHITHRIVDNFGGEIKVDSQEGVGSTFTIFLPIGVAEDDAKTDDKASLSAPRPAAYPAEQSLRNSVSISRNIFQNS